MQACNRLHPRHGASHAIPLRRTPEAPPLPPAARLNLPSTRTRQAQFGTALLRLTRLSSAPACTKWHELDARPPENPWQHPAAGLTWRSSASASANSPSMAEIMSDMSFFWRQCALRISVRSLQRRAWGGAGGGWGVQVARRACAYIHGLAVTVSSVCALHACPPAPSGLCISAASLWRLDPLRTRAMALSPRACPASHRVEHHHSWSGPRLACPIPPPQPIAPPHHHRNRKRAPSRPSTRRRTGTEDRPRWLTSQTRPPARAGLH